MKRGLTSYQMKRLYRMLRRKKGHRIAFKEVGVAKAMSKRSFNSKGRWLKRSRYKFSDWDGDGKINKYDCRPFNRWRQDEDDDKKIISTSWLDKLKWDREDRHMEETEEAVRKGWYPKQHSTYFGGVVKGLIDGRDSMRRMEWGDKVKKKESWADNFINHLTKKGIEMDLSKRPHIRKIPDSITAKVRARAFRAKFGKRFKDKIKGLKIPNLYAEETMIKDGGREYSTYNFKNLI